MAPETLALLASATAGYLLGGKKHRLLGTVLAGGAYFLYYSQHLFQPEPPKEGPT